jgi:hypothetical protein
VTRWTSQDQVIGPGATQAAGPGTAIPRAGGDRAGRPAGLALALSLAAATVLSACSPASAHSSASATTRPAAAPSAAAPSAAGPAGAGSTAACAQVGAALSDGPDPGADPVGYAEAQIRPLRAIRTSDQALRAAIGELAGAYASIFASHGKDASATRTTATASKKVSAICPGAAS